MHGLRVWLHTMLTMLMLYLSNMSVIISALTEVCLRGVYNGVYNKIYIL